MPEGDPRVREWIDRLHAAASFEGVPDYAEKTLARFGATIETYVDELSLGALTLRCWTELQEELKIAPCSLLGIFNMLGVPAACDRSLRRLGTDTIDLYLLHWRGSVPLRETVEAFERLQTAGKIRHWGVSNLDVGDTNELLAVPGGQRCSVNQVLYNLSTRGIEWDLEPLCREHGIPIMAYSPLDQGRLLKHRGLRELASSIGLTPAQLALAWTLRRNQVIAIPKTATRQHLEENLSAWDVALEPSVLDALDAFFEPPTRPEPLAML
jgi:diketogulonate reductase-like aldo/keto reductase